ncbi:MAG: gamma-glutamyltranspeptidase/glutathione hydrolase [Pseudolabrys sp.]|nr:gamma-glutamyltranspeptidase/glutathione hydrolase [Pseudolabrys sp.]
MAQVMTRLLAALCTLALLAIGAAAQTRPQTIAPSIAVHAKNGMVVAQEAAAARVGADILKRGGNAIDAAVAVGFAMAVTYPRAGNIGGGGFMVIHLAKGNENVAIDYRETAPAAATPTMFLDAAGNPDPHKSRDSALSIGVPGTVAGLTLAEAKYGSGAFTLAELMAPAIDLAAKGVPVDDDTLDSLPAARDRLARWPASAAIFLKPDGSPLDGSDILVQKDLAGVLRRIAHDGPAGFYEGDTAQKLAAAIQAAGGLITAGDLKNYRAVIRKPVTGTYHGYDIVSMPPPSSGGIVLLEMLNILEGYDLGHAPKVDAEHWIIEAMKRAYADRAVYMGDPETVKVPVQGLISKAYATGLRKTITERATPAAEIHAGDPAPFEGQNTTHFSVIDRDGNAVSNTYTLNFSYGLGMVAAGTGILLNNELDDFTAKAGAANAYGLVGYAANLPGPNKRPLSSMTPTIVLKDGKPVLVTGSPGGSRIITAVLQVILNALDFHMPIDEAVTAPRLHDQWLPDQVLVEPGFDPAVLAALAARGHDIVPAQPGTSANSIAVTPDGYVGAADTRTRGAFAIGY